MNEFALDDSALLDSSDIFGGSNNTEETAEEQKPAEETKEESTGKEETKKTPAEENVGKEEEDKHKTTTETKYDASDIFGDETGGEEKDDTKSESVGSDDNKDQKQPDSEEPGSSTLNSFAKALKDEGCLTGLSDEELDKIKSPQDLTAAMDREVKSRLDEKQRRIAEALEGGVNVNKIQSYQNILDNLDNIKEEQLSEESDKGKTLRQSIIYQDFINRGMSPERAQSLVVRSFNDGQDIEDAKVALSENRKFFQGKYDGLLEDAQKQKEAEEAEIKKQSEDFRKAILDGEEPFKGIKVDRATRQKAYDAMVNPIATGKDGERLTAVQKYAEDNPVEFRKTIGILWAMTDGFKNMDKIVAKKVKTAVSSHLSEFEQKLRSTSHGNDGNMHYAEGSSSEGHKVETLSEKLSHGWRLGV